MCSREEKTVQDGDDLEQVTGRAIYNDCRIGEIRVGKGNEFMEVKVPGGEHWLQPGQAFGDVDADALKRQMIRRTIKEHLDKEKRLRPQGIKVLSLFFIDAVEHYRSYDADGKPQKGNYATIFEEEYRRLAKHPDYQTLFKEVDLEQRRERSARRLLLDRQKEGRRTEPSRYSRILAVTPRPMTTPTT